MVHSLSILSLLLSSLGLISRCNGYVLQSADAQYASVNTTGLLRVKLSVVEVALDSDLGLGSMLAGRGGDSVDEKRQNAAPLVQRERGNFYVVDLKIGTPPQRVQLAIDTGSSDTWVNPTCDTGTEPFTCQTFARFNVGGSSTARNTNVGMGITYGIGSANGVYWTDVVGLGGATITGQRFGIATSTQSMNIGLMGVGLGNGWGTNYANLIDQLALQGVTQSRAFSLDLASIATAEGSIIFGGIDTGKFSGSLKKLPMIPHNRAPDGFPRYWINMNSVGVTKPGQASSTTYFAGTQAVFLDSGGTLSRLPISIVGPIATALGATSIGSGYYSVPCSLLTALGSVDFGFGALDPLIISVPYSDFIWQAGTSFCYLGLAATGDGDATYVLGDTFLRSAFVVYDVDNFNLQMAPATNCGTNLLAIGSGVNAVPSIAGCSGAASSSVATAKPTSSSVMASTSKSSSNTVVSSSLYRSTSALSTSQTDSRIVPAASSKAASIIVSSTSTTVLSSHSISSIQIASAFSNTSPTRSSSLSIRITSSSSLPLSSSTSSNASTSKLTSSKPATSSTAAKTSSSLQAAITPAFQKCSKDSCFRQMTNAKNQASAVAFCAAYMSTRVPLPTYLNNCKAVPSLVSSACRCAATAT